MAKVQRFFTVLSETCNVKHAARVAGVHAETLYARRRRHPAFAETWRQALAIGYERLEEELLRLSLASLTGEGPSLFDPKEAIMPGTGLVPKASGSPDVQMALLLLNKHRGTVEGTARPNANSKRATATETDAWLEKRLDGLAKRLAAVAK
ncbi:hypothetical protein M9980_13040 [Sphingomonas donggukensis]|uniref:Terminase n=1 Tax=Sphingomonas donggukensis TaxID=2949093 RepID=A0ABY4TT33_9SPHN|nr:hypothetical protein [Sphingomonas donggukensis]URW75442.1 hypothetical protein M9980_13040 [Sphingomonas donggukensis]